MAAPAGETGFTLVEMLVALSIFALGALALLRLNGFAVATTADLDARAITNIVLHNEAALIGTDPGPLVLGTSRHETVNGGRPFEITRTVRATEDQRLVRVDLVALDRSSNMRASLAIVKRVQ